MHYELIKNTKDTKESVNNSNTNEIISPKYSAAAPGYVLLPQNVTAPLAQPENYHLESTNIVEANSTTSTSTSTSTSISTTTTASESTMTSNNSRAYKK